MTRLPGVIGKVSEHKETFYTVLTSFGTLQDSYRASDLEPFSGLVSVNINVLYSKMIAMVVQAWRSVSEDTIINCWRKCYIFDSVIDNEINQLMNIGMTC